MTRWGKALAVVFGYAPALLSAPTKSVTLYTGQGPRTVAPYQTATGQSSIHASMTIAQRNYGYAIFTLAQSRENRQRLEAAAGIRFLGVHGVFRGGHVIYRVAYSQNLETIQAKLRRYSAAFYALEPMQAYDKASPKILRGEGFSGGELDSADSKVFAAIRFHDDVPQRICDSIVRAFCGGYWRRDGLSYIVKESAGRLRDMSAIPEIRS